MADLAPAARAADDLVRCHRSVRRTSVAIVGGVTAGDLGPAAAYASSAERVTEAFRAPALLEASIYLPEVRGGMSSPASTAVGFHLVDYVAHGWDVARSLAAPAEFDDDALQVALALAEAVPDDAKSLDDRTPFRPSVPTRSTVLLDRVVASLGRSPDWTATCRTSTEARAGRPP